MRFSSAHAIFIISLAISNIAFAMDNLCEHVFLKAKADVVSLAEFKERIQQGKSLYTDPNYQQVSEYVEFLAEYFSVLEEYYAKTSEIPFTKYEMNRFLNIYNESIDLYNVLNRNPRVSSALLSRFRIYLENVRQIHEVTNLVEKASALGYFENLSSRELSKVNLPFHEIRNLLSLERNFKDLLKLFDVKPSSKFKSFLKYFSNPEMDNKDLLSLVKRVNEFLVVLQGLQNNYDLSEIDIERVLIINDLFEKLIKTDRYLKLNSNRHPVDLDKNILQIRDIIAKLPKPVSLPPLRIVK